MQDPNFEKRVQQKMDELRLSPSPAVWAGVDAEINKKRKRRPFLWLFFLIGLLVAGLTTYHFYNKNIPKTSSPVAQNQQAEPVQQQSAAKQITDSAAISSDLSRQTQANPKRETIVTDNKKSAGAVTDQHVDRNTSKSNVGIKTHADFVAGNKTGIQEQKIGRQKTKGSKENDSPPPQTINQNFSTQESANVTKSNDSNLVSANPHVTADSAAAAEIVSAEKNKPVQADSAIAKTVAKDASSRQKKRSAITFGFTAGGGFSAMQSNLFHSTNVAFNAFSVPNSAYQGPTPPVSHTPSAIHHHDAFYAGVFAKKMLSKRVSVTAGLTYQYFSTKIQTGNVVDSLLYIPAQNLNATLTNGYYRNGASSNYINRYHFLELPVAVDLQLNKGKKVPLFWEIGFSLARLISATALQFEPVSGLYYKSDDVFNKTQLHLSTSLLAGFTLHRVQIQVGPQFQYGLSGMLNKNLGGSEHLFYSGIKLTIVPGKK